MLGAWLPFIKLAGGEYFQTDDNPIEGVVSCQITGPQSFIFIWFPFFFLSFICYLLESPPGDMQIQVKSGKSWLRKKIPEGVVFFRSKKNRLSFFIIIIPEETTTKSFSK